MSRTSYLRRPLAALLMGAALAASVLMAVVLASPAWADTFTVKNNADSGEGSLRQAIIDANTTTGVADTINFAPSVSGQTITLTSAQLPTITDGAGLTIDGGSADITISGAKQYRIFEVGSGAKLSLNNLTVANGADAAFGSRGGGIYNYYGTAPVSYSTLSGNSGAGIFNSGGTAILENTIVYSPFGGNCSGFSGITNGGYNIDSGTSCGFPPENSSKLSRPASPSPTAAARGQTASRWSR